MYLEIQQVQHKLVFPFLLFSINKRHSHTPLLQVLAGLINSELFDKSLATSLRKTLTKSVGFC